jgi:DNA-binding MarR family transcriptional regulator
VSVGDAPPRVPRPPPDAAAAPPLRHARVDALWAHLHACTLRISDDVQRRLRARFGVSAARFDLMAQLHRRPAGMHMKSLARRLMVTGSNVTGLADELEREGFVSRQTSPADRRVRIVRLTAQGRRAFEQMAREYRQWMLELFCGLDADALDQLHDRLVALRAQLGHPTDFNDEEALWTPPPPASTPPCLPVTAVRRRTTGPRTFAGRSPTASRP